MTKQYTGSPAYICFLSSTKILEHKPGIILTENTSLEGKYIHTIAPKARTHLDAVQNHSNEQLIQFLESEGFTDVALLGAGEWKGFNRMALS